MEIGVDAERWASERRNETYSLDASRLHTVTKGKRTGYTAAARYCRAAYLPVRDDTLVTARDYPMWKIMRYTA